MIVGLVGLATDAAVLYALLWLGGLGPIVARVPSFMAAVTVTYALNRMWTFAARDGRSGARAYFAYLAVQSAAILVNFAVYGAMIASGHPVLSEPIVALCAGAAFSLVMNFIGARRVVFRA